MFVMLYICKRKVKLYSIYTARKRRSRRFSFFCFRARLLFPQMPCSDSLFLSFLPIATCNAPHCSWQSPPLVVAIRPIARGFGEKARYLFKKHQGLFEIPLYVFQNVGRGFKIVGQLFGKVGPTFQKRGRCPLKSWW